MKIPKYNDLNDTAVRRLSQAGDAQRIVFLYALIATVAAAVITGIQFALSARIDQSGGLSNLGIRSLLSSVAQFLPVVQSVFLLVLEFGYMACMVRISRGQYTSPKTLKAGVDRFWPLLRLTLLKALLYSAVGFGSFYLAVLLFLFSPFSNKLMDIMTPLLTDNSILSGSVPVLDAATQQAIVSAVRPAFLFLALVFLVFFIPMYYRYRMAEYVLYDHPESGALFALRESRSMMRGNRRDLFRLDLHFWWFYGLLILVSVVAYGDLIFYLLDIPLPFSDTVGFFLFCLLSLAMQFSIFYFLRNRVETVYALAYESLRPEQKDTGVVLGNIFQM